MWNPVYDTRQIVYKIIRYEDMQSIASSIHNVRRIAIMGCYTLEYDDDENHDQSLIVTREDIEHIRNNTEMFITSCQFAYWNMQWLTQQLQQNSSVINLSIIHTDIPEHAISSLSRCIRYNTTLIEVFFEL